MNIGKYAMLTDLKNNQHVSQRERGFTLLEILVSLAIVGIALTGVLQIFSSDLKGITEADDYVKAAIKAESVMREILDSDELEEGSWVESTEDGYDIIVTVKGIEEDRIEDLSVRLLEVTLKFRWLRDEKERALNLMTVKLIEKPI